jgi:L-malate glycosyltransferase
MKILVITHEYPPLSGGGGIMACAVAEELAKRHSVTVITPRIAAGPSRSVNGNLTIVHIPVIGRVNAEMRSRVSAYFSFASFIISGFYFAFLESFRQRFDIIHSYFAIPAGLIGSLLSTFRHIPHVCTIIEADLFDPKTNCTKPYLGILYGMIRRVLQSSAVITAISSSIKNAALNHYRLSKPVVVIHPGIKMIAKSIPDRISLKIALDDIVIVSVGRLVKRKGFADLITAFARVPDNAAKLIIIGDGPELANLKKLASSLNQQNRIVFTSQISEVEKQKYLCVSDIFALASVHEGFGIVFVEAMECGLPLVATSDGGQTDIITQNENGFLVAPGDIDALTAQLIILARNKPIREKMGLNNRQKVRLFYIDKAAQSFENVFNAALKK